MSISADRPPGMPLDRHTGDTATGTGARHSQGRGAQTPQPQGEEVARFDALMGTMAPTRVRPTEPDDDPDALPLALPLPPLVQVPQGAPPPAAPALAPARAAEVTALVDRVATEFRGAVNAHPLLAAEGFMLRLDLGRSMLGVQSMTLHFAPGVLTLAMVVPPGARPHDFAQAVQALAATLAQRHPGRTIRIEEDESRERGRADSDSAFNPFIMPVSRS